MGETDLIAESVPMARPGFDSFAITAPVMMQINPDGKWASSEPKPLEEERLKAVVAHLSRSNALSAAHSYCCAQCANENKVKGAATKYVPVIMMPIYPNDQCPFNMDSEIEKMNTESEKKPKNTNVKVDSKQEEQDKARNKKKRGFVMQRFNNNDLLSQW